MNTPAAARHPLRSIVTASLCAWLGGIPISVALAEQYFVVPASELEFAKGQDGLSDALKFQVTGEWVGRGSMGSQPDVGPQLRSPESIEAYLSLQPNEDGNFARAPQGELRVAIRTTDESAIECFLDLRTEFRKTTRAFAFTFDPTKQTPSTKEAFGVIKAAHYRRLAVAQLPGTAWFRHLARQNDGEDQPADARGRALRIEGELSPTFAAFSGGRAIAENLALDRELILARASDKPDVAIAEIEGVTVAAIDWTNRLPDDPVKTDPLANFIPLDQHALLFPSMDAMFELLDLVEDEGAPVVQSFDVRSPFRKLPSRYLAQLGIDNREARRKLPVKGLAITGGDPFLPSGTDIALLFETDNPEALFDRLAAQISAKAEQRSAKPIEIAGEALQHRGFQNADRTFSSHLIRSGKLVAVTNSPAQVKQLLAVQKGAVPSLGASEEFAFFRDRYPMGGDESAFLFLSDATIRRWCGPRMRIGASRRARAIAALGELTARRLAAVELGADFKPLLGAVNSTEPGVVQSETFGSFAFMTPVSELPLDTATATEAAAYTNWRRGYQNGWRRVFDPIAVRLSLGEDERRLDLSVLPLTVDSDYQQWIDLAGKATLSPMARHPQKESLLFLSFAIDASSESFKQSDKQLSDMLPGIKINPLAWVDQSVSVFFERDFFWRAMAASGRAGTSFLPNNVGELPVGLRVESNSSIKLALFLTGLRGLSEASAPGLLRWEKRRHGERPYIAVIGNGDDIGVQITLYYAALPKALLVSLDEGILKRAIDRELGAKEIDESGLLTAKHAFMHAVPAFLEGAGGILNGTTFADARRLQSWRALPVLNEWHRRNKDGDPAAAHLATFGTDLSCPGGKGYRWNAAAMTIESVAYGHPADPRDDAETLAVSARFDSVLAGLTFEDDGLRVRAKMLKAKPPQVAVAPGKAEPLASARELTPDRVGTKATYKVTCPDPNFTSVEFELLPAGTFEDQPTLRFKSVGKGDEGEVFSFVADMMHSTEGLAKISQKSKDSSSRYSTPFVELPAALFKDQRSVFSFVAEHEGGEEGSSEFGEVEIVPVGQETITVPAGTFDNCVRVDGVQHSVFNGTIRKSSGTTWYKKGIGTIKIQSTSPSGEFLSELVEFHKPEAE